MPEPLLAVEDVNAYYGRARILQDVSFELGREPVAIIGRNGMGKSTLCLTIMGLMQHSSGSVRLEGEELMGRAPYKIAGAGIGYVPQGRRLFPSLSTEEHLEMLGASNGGRWTRMRSRSCSPVSPSAGASARRSCPAASSRCSPSRGRCSATRSSC